jgi:FkbM family methyltransferase
MHGEVPQDRPDQGWATLELATRHLGRRAFHYRAGTSDEPVIQQIFVQRDYDISHLSRGAELSDFYRRTVASGRTPLIVDAGANIGASALYFADCWPKAHVIAIEPDAANLELLRDNIDGLAQVICVPAALAARSGEMLLVDPGIGHWGYRAVPAGKVSTDTVLREHVCALGMQDMLHQLSGRFAPFVCKIDIEGGERELFAEATDWIDRFPLLVIELHDWFFPRQAASHNFLHAMSVRDRDFVYRGENIFSIANQLPEVT